MSNRERFTILRVALAYLTAEWLAEGQYDPDAPAPTAKEIRACRADQMREGCFDAFELDSYRYRFDAAFSQGES